MSQLLRADLQRCLQLCPKFILEALKARPNTAYVAGGFIRAAVAGEEIQDVDIFAPDEKSAENLAYDLLLQDGKRVHDARVHRTDNAFTVLGRGKKVPQVVHRWTFNHPKQCVESFDFTVACAAFWWGGNASWQSTCDERFYPDLAAKRLTYRSPVRNEDAGGSMLRVLKFYKRGYRIPVDSLAAVVARLCQGVKKETFHDTEDKLTFVLTGLLREVDPMVDPGHIAHLPAETINNPE